MSNRQVQKMFQLMAGGGAVEVTSAMASVKKLARLAFVAQQFGYEYADVRQGGGHNGALKMLIVPDPSPHARQRAAQNWAQFPQAASGGPLPPFVPDALELLKARINFDLTGKSAEKRMLYGALGGTVGCVILAMRTGGDGVAFAGSGVVWALLLGVLGIGFAVTRKRNAKFAARLRAAGFTPVTDETGRVRYLPQGAQAPGYANLVPGYATPQPGHANPFGGAAGTPGAGGPYAPQPGAGGPYAPQPVTGSPYAPQPGASGPYAPQPVTGGPYTPQPSAGGPHAPQPVAAVPPTPQPTASPYSPGPYATPQPSGPYAAPQPPGQYSGPPPAPYAHPGPVPPPPQAYPHPAPPANPYTGPQPPPHQ
ncbi:hypothetical protein [Streptomyces sp. NPDC058694]|uniref:hypothetical protein n=1 Tax=Streptomyces sp. NPDC058694 TaxID=3346603 RepID=UPI0036534FF1